MIQERQPLVVIAAQTLPKSRRTLGIGRHVFRTVPLPSQCVGVRGLVPLPLGSFNPGQGLGLSCSLFAESQQRCGHEMKLASPVMGVRFSYLSILTP